MKHPHSRICSHILLACAVLVFAFAGSNALAIEFAEQTLQSHIDEPRQATLRLKDGSIVVGEILDQNTDVVRFRGRIHGIEFTTDYLTINIEQIVMFDPDEQGPGDDTPDPTTLNDSSNTPISPVGAFTPAIHSDDSNAHRVYFAELKGEFGRNISQTLIRKLTADARKENADTIIFSLDATWDPQNPFQGWDELLRYEEIAPALTDEIQSEFAHAPRVVTWVHQAMGGASLIPLCNREIYMASDGMIGGMSGLDRMMKGDRTVVEKQRSLRLQHATGWVIKGGYDRRILYAMAVVEFDLCYRYLGDEVEFFERLPEGPDEVLLTDAGPDTMADIVRGRGKAYLNIDSDTGRDIKVSKGTADTKEELFAMMGVDRNRIDVGSADRICKQWDRRIQYAEDQLLQLWNGDYNQTQVTGSYEERSAARGRRKRALGTMLNLLTASDLKEVFDTAYRAKLRIPIDAELQYRIFQIEIEQMRDKR